MAWDRIDRLDLASISFACSRIQEYHIAEAVLQRVAVDRAAPSGCQGEVGWLMRWDVGRQHTAGGQILADASVEHMNVGVAERVEHPPQPGSDSATSIVIGDDGVLGPDAPGAKKGGEADRIRKRMAARTLRSGQVLVEIEKDSPRDMASEVVSATATALCQGPPYVCHSQSGIVQTSDEVGRAHEGHSPSMPAAPTMERMRSGVLVVGDVAMDQIVRVSEYPPRGGNAWSAAPERHPGGSAANTAVNLAKMGVEVRFLGRFADDVEGEMLLADMRGEGVEVVPDGLLPGAATPIVIAIVDGAGERTLISASRASAQTLLSPADVTDDVFGGVFWVHVSGVSLAEEPGRSALVAALTAARARGLPSSFDINLRLDGTDFDGLVRVAVRECIQLSTVVLASTSEAMTLVPGADDVNACALALAGGLRTAVVRLGAAGAISVDRSGRIYRDGGRPGMAVDTLGAGDAFDAGYIRASLDGADPQACLRWGNAAAALKSRHLGARGFPGMAELLELSRES